MAIITDASVRVEETGQVLKADCFGNNAAVDCPHCHTHPVLLIARPNQRGASAKNPSRCRQCGATFYILDRLVPGKLKIVNIAVNPPQ